MRAVLLRVTLGVAVLAGALVAAPKPAHAIGGGINVGDATIVEGDAISRDLFFPLTLPYRSTTQVTVKWAVTGGTAVLASPSRNPEADVLKKLSGTVKFNVNQNTGLTQRWSKITLQGWGDERDEDTETVEITITGVTGPFAVERGTAVGTILDDDPGPPDCLGFPKEAECPVLVLSAGDVSVVEGDDGVANVRFMFMLNRSPWNSYVRVPFTVTGTGGAEPIVNGVGDYSHTLRGDSVPVGGKQYMQDGTILFGNHDLGVFITVRVQGDAIADPGEGLQISLGTPEVFGNPKTVIVDRPDGFVTIIDDEV